MDRLAATLRFEEGKDPAALLHELFLLKAGIAAEYAMGMLEKLGMEEPGILQFHELYTNRLAEGLAAVSRESMQGRSVTMLLSRMRAYSAALHQPNPEDPHLNVADYFSRMAGAPDDPELVTLCLDACKALNRVFLDEMAALGGEAKG